MVNDPSGLSDPERGASVRRAPAPRSSHAHARAARSRSCATRATPTSSRTCRRFLRARLEQARALGRAQDEQLLLCPGPDLGKEPAQTIELLRRLDELHELGRPILLAVSRKDFVGALLERPPRERLAGTLAAVAHGVARGAHVLRAARRRRGA